MKNLFSLRLNRFLISAFIGLLVLGLQAATPQNGEDKDRQTIFIPGTKATFAPVVKKVAPSVVNVYSTKTVETNPRLLPFFNNPMFREFFGDEPGGTNRSRSRQEQSLGSGVIISADGYILTNFHVVEGADEVQVVLASDDREFTAKVVGTDPATDLAVLKVNATSLPSATLGDSDQLEIGDVVLAVGNPFGVGQTVTMGIVSATGRGGFGIVDYEDFIQTDAAISPGNSGGPLTDSEGRVVGISTAILTSSRGGQGIGFAVPVNLARGVMEQIIREGRVVRGSLGVAIQPLTPALARQFKLPEHTGALVGDVTPNSPASKAGLKPGDVIVEFNSKKVSDPRHLRLLAGQTRPGTKVEITVMREGKERTVTAVLGELPQRIQPKIQKTSQPAIPTDLLDGVTVTDLDEQMRHHLKVPISVQGPLVLSVEEDSAAFASGLRPGDVLQELNRQTVRNSQQAISLSRKLNAGEMLMRVWSEGNSRYLTISQERTKLHPPLIPSRE
jgi:serine protease Do